MKPNLEVTPVFERNFDSKKKIVINRGGTRSSKTYSLAQLSVLFLFTGYVSPEITLKTGVWSSVRATLPALKATVLRDFEEILRDYDLHKFLKVNKSDLTYRYQERMVEFFSVDDQQKVRGRKRDVLHINEANELDFRNDFFQLNIRTQHRVYIDFNPDDENIWINTELERKRAVEEGDVDIIISSYKDNTFLSDNLIKEIELLKGSDPEYWKIFGMGEYGRISGLIFPEITIVKDIPKDARFIGCGLDFGFVNDHTACYEVYMQNGELWINELIYETGMTNKDIYDRSRSIGFDTTLSVVADSAEPKSIYELRSLGMNISEALKGPDSVKNGIDILKRYKINVTSRSKGILKEQRAYKWEVDRNGNPTNKPVDRFNHGWDAVRYVALNKLANKPKRELHIG